MVDMYYRLVKAGLRTIQKVPERYRDAVMLDLSKLELHNRNTMPTLNESNIKIH
ncbi:CD1375 family protein [Clostridium sp.]